MSETATKLSGTVKWFSEHKGYGFIERDDRSGDIFCHVSEIPEEYDYPKQGDKVTFIEGADRVGRSVACR